MNIGSLSEIRSANTERYINSVCLECDDMICILGDTALHHALDEHDAIYLWEFAALNESDDKKHLVLSGLRKDIDAYHDTGKHIKDEQSFEANKKTISDRVDTNLSLLKGTPEREEKFKDEISRLEDFKKRIQSEQYPKSWLAKKIQWFRNLYAKFMHKNSVNPQPGVKGFFKRILATIARIIDTLAKKLQNAVN